jgi:hypothetical protein
VLVLLDGVAEAAVAAVAPRVGAALVIERCCLLLGFFSFSFFKLKSKKEVVIAYP